MLRHPKREALPLHGIEDHDLRPLYCPLYCGSARLHLRADTAFISRLLVVADPRPLQCGCVRLLLETTITILPQLPAAADPDPDLIRAAIATILDPPSVAEVPLLPQSRRWRT
jgi:hypothetical protein